MRGLWKVSGVVANGCKSGKKAGTRAGRRFSMERARRHWCTGLQIGGHPRFVLKWALFKRSRHGLLSGLGLSHCPMSAPLSYKIGNEKLVKVSDAAAKKVRTLLERQGRSAGALRVAVLGGGCSGLQYKMDLVDGPVARDILVESAGVRVVVDPKSALFVSGSLVDYSEDLQKGGFKVTNPNAVSHCSCGESFSA